MAGVRKGPGPARSRLLEDCVGVVQASEVGVEVGERCHGVDGVQRAVHEGQPGRVHRDDASVALELGAVKRFGLPGQCLRHGTVERDGGQVVRGSAPYGVGGRGPVPDGEVFGAVGGVEDGSAGRLGRGRVVERVTEGLQGEGLDGTSEDKVALL